MDTKPQGILDFWFSGRVESQWFASTPELDQEIRERYQAVWERASCGALDDWAHTADGSLALVIVLDQFPLNMFRGEARSFAWERKSVEIALHAIDKKFDETIARERLAFLYMPLMHSEELEEQDLSVTLYEKRNLKQNLKFAEHHRDIIRRFGRFPHRNSILGRESTQDEMEYLASDEAYHG